MGLAPTLTVCATDRMCALGSWTMSYFTCGVFFLLLIIASALSYPWSESGAATSHHRTECDNNDDTQTLCQRCAKSTKSNIVYPMCCEDKEEARNWCYHYLTFGIQGQ